MPLIRLISQSFRFCNFRLPNLNTKTRMWFGWEERHEQQTRYHFPFSLNPFRADSEANGTELSLHQPRFVGKAAAGDFFPNLNKFYFSFGVGCFFFFLPENVRRNGKCSHPKRARAPVASAAAVRRSIRSLWLGLTFTSACSWRKFLNLKDFQ